MKQPLLFLSHAGEDAAAAQELARHLERSDVPVWLDVERLRPGDRWMESLERALEDATAFAVYVGRSGVARWVGQEVRVALDRSVAEEGFAVIPVLGPGSDPAELPVFLRQRQWVDLRGGLDDPAGLRELAEVVVGEDRRGERVRRSLLPPDRAPFLGLRTFGEDDAFLFFGRDREVEELLDRLGAAPFLAVVGASGSGKSSLVRAGLLPALRRGRAPGGRQGAGSGAASGSPVASWRIALFRPADDPFRELAAALPGLDPDLGAADRIEVGARIARELADPGAGAAQGIERAVAALVPAGTRTLLVADQLEEAFTQTGDPELRRRFLDALLAAGRLGGDRPVHVVATLRADFYSRCWEHPELPSRIAANQLAVERMASDQLREVIEKPLALAGVEPEPGLVDELLDDAGDEPGNLPLLEHALFQLWDQPAGRRFTHEAYRAMGGLAGALEHHAEAVYEGLDAEQRDLLRRLLPRLAVVGDPGAVTRRRVPKEDLLAASGPVEEGRARAAALLDLWVERRLLTAMGAGAEAGEERVEAAHEALLRSWDRLRGWLEEDREFLLWRQGLAEAVDAWECGGRGEGDLLRGNPLRRAADWLERRRQDLTPSEADLIAASLGQERAERRRKLAQARKLTLAVGGVALLLLVLLIAALAGFRSQRRQALLATARELAPRAEPIAETRPQLGTLLALRSLELAEQGGAARFPAGETALRAGLARLGGRVVGDPVERVLAAAVTEEAVVLATTGRGGEGETLHLRRILLPLPPDRKIAVGEGLEVEGATGGKLFEVALAPSGEWLAAKREQAPLRLWRISPWGSVRPVELILEDRRRPATGVASLRFSRDPFAEEAHLQLVAVGTDELERRWSLPESGFPAEPLVPDSVVAASAVHAPEIGSCARYRLYPVEGGLQARPGPLGEPEHLAFQPIRDQVLAGHDLPVEGCQLGAGRRYLLTWTAQERARLWDLQTPAPHRGPEPTWLVPEERVRPWAVAPRGSWLLARVPTEFQAVQPGADGALQRVSSRFECPAASGDRASASSADGAFVAYVGLGNEICLGRLDPPGPKLSPLPIERVLAQAGGAEIPALGVSPGAHWVSVGTDLGDVVLARADGECRELPRLLRGHLKAVTALAFSADGRWHASGGADGLVLIHRFADPAACEGPEVVPRQSRSAQPVASLAFGRRHLAIGDRSGAVRLWDLEASEPGDELPLVGHRAPVGALAFDESGERLASADAEDEIWLWELAPEGSPPTGSRLGRGSGSEGVGFAESGEDLLTLSRERSAHLWTLDVERLRTLACRAVGRNLSPAEAREHLEEDDPPLVCPGLPRGVD